MTNINKGTKSWLYTWTNYLCCCFSSHVNPANLTKYVINLTHAVMFNECTILLLPSRYYPYHVECMLL